MSASVCCAEYPANEIREVSQLYEATHGLKRGRGLLADRAGISERRLRALLWEAARPYADEFLRVQAAAMVVRRERAARLRAEFEALEQEIADGGDRTCVANGGVEPVRDDRLPLAGLRMAGGKGR